MNAPVRLQPSTMASDSIHLRWMDPSLGNDQLIRDNRYYTVRYWSYDHGQYNYMNVTDLRAHIDGLTANTEYHFSVRVNDPPYLSEWSDDVKNKTNTNSEYMSWVTVYSRKTNNNTYTGF